MSFLTPTCLPSSLFPHVVSLVEREGVVGQDENGAPVEGWVSVYTNLVAQVAPASTRQITEWLARDIVADVVLYFPPQDSLGNVLPVLGVRDRLTFGTWPDGTTRFLTVSWVRDEANMGVLLTVAAQEVRPG